MRHRHRLRRRSVYLTLAHCHFRAGHLHIGHALTHLRHRDLLLRHGFDLSLTHLHIRRSQLRLHAWQHARGLHDPGTIRRRFHYPLAHLHLRRTDAGRGQRGWSHRGWRQHEISRWLRRLGYLQWLRGRHFGRRL
ncbi:hypothetical protein D3C81_573010 [compost metagenome]